YREYRDVQPLFTYVVETDKRFYLANEVTVKPHADGSDAYFEVHLNDAWVWDMYRTARFVSSVRILTFNDVNIEEAKRPESLEGPEGLPARP
ncbi:MAG TPA: DUF2469 family protein, partial [Actinomycetota bacterium]|nr:DUF2469 family protein [Actinomycetota bacterium]